MGKGEMSSCPEKEGGGVSKGKSTQTTASVPPPPVTAEPQMTPTAGGGKKKRPTKAQKAERKAKREADTLKEFYKPKDSHVHVVNSDIFRLLKGQGTKESGKKQEVTFQDSPTVATSDFPCLESASSTPRLRRSFASVISSPAPPPQKVEGVVGSDSSKQVPSSSSSTPQPQASSSSSGVLGTPVNSASGIKKTSKTPFVISLDSLIVKKDKESRALTLNKQSGKRKSDRITALIRENVKFTVGNALDSSSPGVIHRGKIKLKPKKPSKLKRCILKSRELRKNQIPTAFNVDELKSSPLVQVETIKEEVNEESAEEPVQSQENSAEAESKCNHSPGEGKLEAIKEVTSVVEEDKDVKIFKEILNKAEIESKPKETVPMAVVDLVKLEMHNRKFRNYCDMFVTKEFHMGCVVPMLKELYRLQNRLYQTDPIKFKTKRRFVNGLKDTLSGLKLNKVQMVILAPDIEPNNQQGGLDERVSEIIAVSKEKGVPYVFSGNRYVLGKAIMQLKSPISAIAIFNKQSVEELFNKVIEAAEVLRENYRRTFDEKLQKMLTSGNHTCESKFEE